jgi:hypothetical protein
VGQGSIAVPGSIGSVLVERPASIEEGFSQNAPLVYHYGHLTPGHNSMLYNKLVRKFFNFFFFFYNFFFHCWRFVALFVSVNVPSTEKYFKAVVLMVVPLFRKKQLNW